jgi:hypothetical protein
MYRICAGAERDIDIDRTPAPHFIDLRISQVWRAYCSFAESRAFASGISAIAFFSGARWAIWDFIVIKMQIVRFRIRAQRFQRCRRKEKRVFQITFADLANLVSRVTQLM